MTYLNMNREKRDRIFRSLLNIGMVGVVALTLFGCGDFRDEPQPPTAQPHVDPPTTPETPQTPQTPQTPEKPQNPSVEKMNEMCEAERQWALTARLIDINQSRLFQRRNFAPVFNTPGERQSGIDGWVGCRRALEINGFVTFRNEPQSPTPPIVVQQPSEPTPPQIPEQPRPPQPPQVPQTPVEKMNEMCEAERQWALTAGLIDINQLRLFQGRNFAPAFRTPGERQSGIEGWLPCQKALEINGFITN